MVFALVAGVRLVIPEVTPIFSVAPEALVRPPVPDNAVVAVTVPLFVSTTAPPVTVSVVTVKVPLFA